VAIPPFPAWVQTDAALASTAVLLRRLHDASVGFIPPSDAVWDTELADPQGGEVIGHNDVCPENVVFRSGEAVALLDFDFAAPGRRVFDFAHFARMFVPIDSQEDAARLGRGPFDPFARLRIAADAYGLPPDRTELIDVLSFQIAQGGAFVQRRVDAGDAAFTTMWNQMGGNERYERRREWFAANRKAFVRAIG
jgi:thiamine kinase-like enzyme